MSYPALTFDDCLQPDWRVSPRVRALVTTRSGGVSPPPYGRMNDGAQAPGGLNLGLRTDDDRAHVEENRARLRALVGAEPAWLQQVHSNTVVRADDVLGASEPPHADASVTSTPGVACVVMAADCMPVLLADEAGRAVGAAHAGWRGLVAGVVESTARQVAVLAGAQPETLHAYLGPAIGPGAFEVGDDVRDAFMAEAQGSERGPTSDAFVPRAPSGGKYLADLYALARLRLARHGIVHVTGGDACTFTERDRFYSYRRDRVTGRMAALVWLAE